MREGANVGSTITKLIDIVNDRLQSSLKENPTLNYTINFKLRWSLGCF